MATFRRFLSTSLLVLPLAIAACGDSGSSNTDTDNLNQDGDGDGDGFSPNEGDCNDTNRHIYPGAPEPCDGIDNDCDGIVDEGFDLDGDGWTTCAGDCRDNDASSYPGAPEMPSGIDNDCDGIVDNNTDQYDDDGDGFSEDQGDCNDYDSMIGPNAIEIPDDGIDNDCDGIIDEAIEPCPTDLPLSDARAFASALDLCHEVIQASIDPIVDQRSQAVMTAFGDTYLPFQGPNMVVLSTGVAWDANDPGYDPASGSTAHSSNLNNTVPHPSPQPAMGTCGGADQPNVNDYSELSLSIQVPANASAFSFDFNFMSVEFPEFVCTSFDDTFLAMLESAAFTGNVSFDSMGSRVSINVGFFDVCEPGLDPACTGEGELLGTGFEVGGQNFQEGGGTGWLTTTAPVVPGEKILLTFMIFDEGDHILDSTVLIDNFQWHLEEVDEPITVDRRFGPTTGLRGPAIEVGPVLH